MKGTMPKYLFHKSSPLNRGSILHSGLLPKIGSSYLCYWEGKKNLRPLIFFYDKNVMEYDTTYDDDVYKIDVQKLDKRRISRDPDKDMHGCYCYSLQIATRCFTLVLEGTGEEV